MTLLKPVSNQNGCSTCSTHHGGNYSSQFVLRSLVSSVYESKGDLSALGFCLYMLHIYHNNIAFAHMFQAAMHVLRVAVTDCNGCRHF
jgi:hypothetical protein